MADLEKVKQAIKEIAQGPNNVTLDHIEWVVRQLEQHHGFTVKIRQTKHSILYRINDQRFGVNMHNTGNKQVKSYSVTNFLDAMIELELYEG